MSPSEYCESAASPPGSATYYSLLYCPPEMRRVWNALLALREELARVSIECREREVGSAKLHWWHEELQGLADGGGRHPLSTELARVARESGLTLPSLAALPGAYFKLLDAAPFAAPAELDEHCAQTGGLLHALGARCARSASEEAVRSARALGTAFEAAELLFETPARARAGRTTFPPGERREAAIAHIQSLLRAAREESRGAPRNQLYLDVRADIIEGRLRKLAGRRDEAPTETVDLLPLAKLYIAWRTRRRHRAARAR